VVAITEEITLDIKTIIPRESPVALKITTLRQRDPFRNRIPSLKKS
jgi:hypothetical protein